jgi:prevent-host-death family protein
VIQKREAEKVISATDAKNKFGALIAQVAETGETVVVERQGKARAAIISLEDYREFRRLKELERRHEAWKKLEQLRQEISERNKDMTEEEIEEFAQQLRDEVMAAVVERYETERGRSIYE